MTFLNPVCEQSSNAGQQIMDPISVPFGPNSTPIKIADGATALGYLFSLAEPHPDAGWKQYWLPLCLLYSRCIYLAFIKDHASQINAINSVPSVVNVMYMTSQQNLAAPQRPFMFGATIATYQAFSGDSESRERKKRTAAWRRAEILTPALRQRWPEATLPINDLDLKVLAERLHQLFVGSLKSWNETDEAYFTDLLGKAAEKFGEASFATAGIEQYMPVRPHRLLKGNSTELLLRDRLKRILHRRAAVVGAAGSVETDAKLASEILDLLIYYVTPHIFPKKSSNLPEVEYPALPGQEIEIRKYVTDWWDVESHRAAAYRKLQYLVDRFDQYNDPVSASYSGFCAETYPVVGVG